MNAAAAAAEGAVDSGRLTLMRVAGLNVRAENQEKHTSYEGQSRSRCGPMPGSRIPWGKGGRGGRSTPPPKAAGK